MLETLKGVVGAIIGANGFTEGIIAAVLVVILRYIPNDKIQLVVDKFFYGLGVASTLGLSKFTYTAPFWNSIVEPWLIDIFDNTVGTATKALIRGWRSDNPK